ncbi:MAG: hypothetical protein M1825_001057 [Sarcosagium campestre]|nr:MAG: hypothetical protein M1825_001057 [Sarcosagium campestre]
MASMTTDELFERLRQAEQRAEQAEQRAQKERQERLEADQRAQKEQQERLEAEQQTRKERQERLEADQRAGQAEQRAQKEQQERLEAEQRVDQVEERIRLTTLKEFLSICHNNLGTALAVETDKSRTSTGFTSPQGRKCPIHIRPWNRFLSHRERIWRRFLSVYPFDSDVRRFKSREHIVGLAGDLRPIANETDIVRYLDAAIERRASEIFECLVSMPEVRREFHLGDSIVFSVNPKDAFGDKAQPGELRGVDGLIDPLAQQHLHSASYTSTSVGESVLTSASPSPLTPPPGGRTQVPSDLTCIRIDQAGGSSTRTLAYLAEYKPPHKLTRAMMECGLRPMNITTEIINAAVMPAKDDEEAVFRYHSERLVTSAITQTYDYMIRTGLKYGYITTGEAYIFLHVRKDDPTTLYYHLTEPTVDFEQNKDSAEGTLHTALGQVLSFCLLALGSRPRPQRWRNRVLKSLVTWEVDEAEIVKNLPESVKKMARRESLYRSSAHPDPSSPAETRSRRQKRNAGCSRAFGSMVEEDEDADPPADTSGKRMSTRTSKSRQTRKSSQKTSRRGRRADQSNDERIRSYCTHECLMGLIRQDRLDTQCPNVDLHGHFGYHPLDRETLLRQIQRQLRRSLDRDCYELDLDGAQGTLFQVRHRRYGYTLVAKGTVSTSVHRLRHEGVVYEHLNELQGVCIPAYLGNFDLEIPYFHKFGYEIVHMMLLTWAGDALDYADPSIGPSKVLSPLQRVHKAGVLHGDVRRPNVRWIRGKGVMLIDFERSIITEDGLDLEMVLAKRDFKGYFSQAPRSEGLGLCI